jgi:hypothetical protein
VNLVFWISGKIAFPAISTTRARDGYGGIDDIVAVAEHFGASGTPSNWTQLLLDVSELQSEVATLNSKVTALEGQKIEAFCGRTNVRYTTQSWTPPPASINADDIKVDFPVTFTNPANVELSVSGFVVTGTCANSPLRITGVVIESTYAILTLQGWNGAMWINLSNGDEVEISYVAIER